MWSYNNVYYSNISLSVHVHPFSFFFLPHRKHGHGHRRFQSRTPFYVALGKPRSYYIIYIWNVFKSLLLPAPSAPIDTQYTHSYFCLRAREGVTKSFLSTKHPACIPGADPRGHCIHRSWINKFRLLLFCTRRPQVGANTLFALCCISNQLFFK